MKSGQITSSAARRCHGSSSRWTTTPAGSIISSWWDSAEEDIWDSVKKANLIITRGNAPWMDSARYLCIRHPSQLIAHRSEVGRYFEEGDSGHIFFVTNNNYECIYDCKTKWTTNKTGGETLHKSFRFISENWNYKIIYIGGLLWLKKEHLHHFWRA